MPQVQAFLDPNIFKDSIVPDWFKLRVNEVFAHTTAKYLRCTAQPDISAEWFMIVWHDLKPGDAFTRPMAFMMHVQHYTDRNLSEAVLAIRTDIQEVVEGILQFQPLGLPAHEFAVEVEISDGHNLEFSITPPRS